MMGNYHVPFCRAVEGVTPSLTLIVASAQEICNRGIETYCRQGLCRTETACQVEVAGAMSLANWRRESSLRAGMSQRELGSPTHNL